MPQVGRKSGGTWVSKTTLFQEVILEGEEKKESPSGECIA